MVKVVRVVSMDGVSAVALAMLRLRRSYRWQAVVTLRVDEYPAVMRRAGGLRPVLRTVGEANQNTRLGRTALQLRCPKLLPVRIARPMQHIQVELRDKIAGAKRSILRLELG
jgi:hypothetical protein